MDDFGGKVAVVTGAGSGIGRALALRCAREGMRVVAADVKEERLTSLRSQLEELGADVLAAAVDVSSAAAVGQFAADCERTFGVPDLLFNNAGILRLGETWSHEPGDWQTMLSINVLGVVHGLNAFVPRMLAAGKPAHIVNTGSVGSLVAAPGMAQYTAAKMAVRGITECLQYDLAAQEAPIGVSLLCPGPVLTSISDDLMGIESGAPDGDPADHLMAGQPDFITADEVAERTFAGIRSGDFWIFTHPFGRYLEGKSRAIVDGAVPVYSEVTFD
ncbi:MAG: SDR family NAD(P)-dependent oxidoreductase [Halioglobus sp.]|nr:SDR family NAD(P)-dependent oxidoreductase [Halioglobus sp.]